MHYIIISAGSKEQVEYWEGHFAQVSSCLLPYPVKFIVVHEDWNNGAGNGFGTLYAYLLAKEKLSQAHNLDLWQEQQKGSSVAIYHTAGQGTRLYPLAGSEYGIKSAVKLPSLLNETYMTILDAVIKQTSDLYEFNKGRLSVFWGDQLFFPEKMPPTPKQRYHVEILTKLITIPGEKEWKTQGIHQYGLITIGQDGTYQLIDKCDYTSFRQLINNKKISIQGGLGISLGSFSLSSPMTLSLLELFKSDLEEKKKKIDSDPFFWMPTVLDVETYLEIMQKKDEGRRNTEIHFQRMQAFKQRFIKKNPELPYFGGVNLGSNCLWWDYGTVENYFRNNLKLNLNTEEGLLMRKFFNLELSGDSCILGSDIKAGNIKNSILVGVKADYLDVENCIIINSSLGNVNARNCLIYNAHEERNMTLKKDTVRADVNIDGQDYKLTTSLYRDGKIDWKLKINKNKLSYEEIYKRTMHQEKKDGSSPNFGV